jgi:hypothetical protein
MHRVRLLISSLLVLVGMTKLQEALIAAKNEITNSMERSASPGITSHIAQLLCPSE